jgi:ATP adenylyltransferase/5',5'''-P-1,P-4-tetraphosphate phosphorylase II
LSPFDASGFHFNKPFLGKEIFWQGELNGKAARLLYNKFPFARLHGLLVPEPERQWPQMLTHDLHDWAWESCTTADVPGLCLGYNSMGAGASVNHLHFQSFVHADLPLQHPRFIHNGGDAPYPLPCQRLNNAQAAWSALDALHQRNQPYNLIYSRDALYVITRAPQDSTKLSATCKGYGWSEMAGVLNLFNRERFDTLSADAFTAELASFAD